MPSFALKLCASARAFTYETSTEPAAAANVTISKQMLIWYGEMVQQAAQHQQFGIAIADRIDEGAPVTGLAAQAGHRSIQRIDGPGDEHDQAPQADLAARHQQGRNNIPCHAQQRDGDRRNASPVHGSGNGLQYALEHNSQVYR